MFKQGDGCSHCTVVFSRRSDFTKFYPFKKSKTLPLRIVLSAEDLSYFLILITNDPQCHLGKLTKSVISVTFYEKLPRTKRIEKTQRDQNPKSAKRIARRAQNQKRRSERQRAELNNHQDNQLVETLCGSVG